MPDIEHEDPTRYGLTNRQADLFNGAPRTDLYDLADELGITVPNDVEPYGRYVRKFLRDALQGE
jgi:hypothetical protein